MSATITCRRIGRKYEQHWPGRSALGYSVMAERHHPGGVSTWVAGFATQTIDNWGRKGGWIILDPETGKTIFGLGESTAIGKGLGECLFLFERRLEEAEDRTAPS